MMLRWWTSLLKTAVCVMCVQLTLSGCAPRTSIDSAPPAETLAVTLHEYIADNGVAETRVRRGDPGTPTVTFAPPLVGAMPAPRGEPTANSLSGYPAVDYVGTFLGGGERKAIGQITIAVPGATREVFVYQLNAVAPPGEEQVVLDAVTRIVTDTRITAPS